MLQKRQQTTVQAISHQANSLENEQIPYYSIIIAQPIFSLYRSSGDYTKFTLHLPKLNSQNLQ